MKKCRGMEKEEFVRPDPVIGSMRNYPIYCGVSLFVDLASHLSLLGERIRPPNKKNSGGQGLPKALGYESMVPLLQHRTKRSQAIKFFKAEPSTVEEELVKSRDH